MAFSIGNGRYYKLFPGNDPPRRVLIKDLSEPGLLSMAFIQGIVVKVFPIKCSERFGKLCKIVVKEDVEKSISNSQLAVISTFLLGDLADEGSRICEGDCVVLAEVIVECSPTCEHPFQLIVWREKSQASIWVINNKGKVRANTAGGIATISPDEAAIEEPVVTKTVVNSDVSANSDEDLDMLFESCENDFSKSTSKDGRDIRKQTRQKVFGERKGKFHLGPKGVTPSTSHVKRSLRNMTVLLDKEEAKEAIKTCQEDKYSDSKSATVFVHSKGNSRKEGYDSCTNVSSEPCTCTTAVPNAGVSNAGSPKKGTPNAGTPDSWKPNACTTSAGDGNINGSHTSPVSHYVPSVDVETGGPSMIVSQTTGPGRGAESPSLEIQSTDSDKLSKIQCTHSELTPSRMSRRIRNGDPLAEQVRDQSRMPVKPNNLSPFMATEAGCSLSEICDFQNKPGEDFVVQDFEQEEHVFQTARRMSAPSEIHHGSPAKGTTERSPGIPHHSPSSSARTMIPDDYTPASSLLAIQDSSDRGVKRSPVHLSVDSKRLKASPVLWHPALSPDRAENSFRDRSKKRSSRAAADYTVPPGYTTLANLQADTTVNVYGVVKLFKPAWKCRGTDMCSVLVLMDPTIAESSTGLECVSFQPNVTRLPTVHRIGDIVRLHRIKISQYQGRLQAKSTRGFAAIVFDRETELPVTAEMARVSSSTFTLTQSDKETVESLKNWCDVHPILFPPANAITLSQINPDSYFDLTCQVLGIALHRTLDCVVLYVADGTQPVHDLRKCTGDEYNMVEPLCNRSSHDDDVISVFLYGSHAEVARLLVRKDGYVILHNVHSQVLKPGGSVCSVLDVVKPYLELCVHRGTAFGRGISVLSADSPEVIQLKKQQNV